MNKNLYLIPLIVMLTWQDGFTQNVMDFDGINDNITVSNASSFIANGQLSLSFWIYPTNPNTGWPDFDGYAGFRNEFNADFYLLQLNASTVEARFRNSSGIIHDIVYNGLNLNAWNHFVLTYDNSTLTLYHNGTSVGTTSANGSITSSTETLNIGYLPFGGNNFYTDGQMDDVALWDKSLSAGEVTALYNDCGVDPSSAGLVLLYEFNQGFGGGNNMSISSAIDSKGNANGSLNSFGLNGGGSNFLGDSKARSNSITNLTVFECDFYTSPSGKNVWTTTGMYQDTLTKASGCDSIIVVDLTVEATSSATLSLSACDSLESPSGLYVWRNSGTYADTISNMAGCDSVLVVKLTIGTETTSTLTETACSSYTSPSGRYNWDSSGTYLDTLVNNRGCDSVMTIDLTISDLDTSVSRVDHVQLMANMNGVTYQWIDCQTGMAVDSATNQTFMATENGSYAVVVTDMNMCSDTSSCFDIAAVNLLTTQHLDLRIYPNPVEHIIHVEFGQTHADLTFRMSNLLGQEVLKKEFKHANDTILDVESLPKGVYILQVKADHQLKTIKVLKE
ncbi:MAG: LamG-like jellyroll fold domain-containing protein [Bacteroidota bacterium]